MDNIKLRYILSIVFDVALVELIVYQLMFVNIFDFSHDLNLFILLLSLSFFLVQDKLLFGAGIGKRIFVLRVVCYSTEERKCTFAQVVSRRILEMFYVSKIFLWHLWIDIDKITNTKILTSYQFNKRGKTKILPQDKSNIKKPYLLKRVYAFLIDLALVSWLILIYIALKIPTIKALISGVSASLGFWLSFVTSVALTSYLVLRDLFFRNGSYGKMKMGLEVVDMDGKIPSKFQLVLRNMVITGFFPIELILFVLGHRLFGELLTYSQVRQRTSHKKNK